jgi:tRNA uridine 5-carboxymethylaminomethyl modification enzyme
VLYINLRTDAAGIQFQILNRSKGAAGWVCFSLCPSLSPHHPVQGPRAQIDRKLYKKHMQNALLNYPNLDVRAGSVFDLVFSHAAPQAPISSSGGDVWATVDGIRLGSCLAPFVLILLPLTRHQTRGS